MIFEVLELFPNARMIFEADKYMGVDRNELLK
jgi:hypothetical protein